MSLIYFTICALFLTLTISAILPPQVIYSAVIHNAHGSPIKCSIKWLKFDSFNNQSFTVDNDKDLLINEKLYRMDTWIGRETIEAIRCGDFQVTAPFDGVLSPSINWRFIIEPNQIKSVGSDNNVKSY